MDVDWKTVEQIFDAHRATLIAVPGVTGAAIGTCDGGPCIRVFVTDAGVLKRGAVPGTLEGIPVKIEVSGPFDARSP